MRDDLAIGALEDQVKAAKDKSRSDVLEDISKNSTPDGQWRPKGHSVQPFPEYSASQKICIGNRLMWLTERDADNLSSEVGAQGSVPGMDDEIMIGEYIHKYWTCTWV